MTPQPDNSDPRDYILDLSTAPAPPTPSSPNHSLQPDSEDSSRKTAFLSIHFKCCNVYAPIYRNRTSTAYAGHCPRCRRAVTIPISEGGTSDRIFAAE